MDKYSRKVIWILAFCLLGALIVFYTNNKGAIQVSAEYSSYQDGADLPQEEPLQTVNGARQNVLILYSPGNEVSEKYETNLRNVFRHMRMETQSLPLSRAETVSYAEYDLIVMASGLVENELTDPATRLLDYVEDGGRLLWGILPDETGAQFRSIYRRLGMIDYGEYVECQRICFTDELIPGISGRVFEGEAFQDVCLSVTLEERAHVYAKFGEEGKQIPLIWNYPSGDGSVTVFNGTAVTGDFWRGIAAGCVSTLYEDIMYPVINALCVFIDDFPSAQYESESDVVRKEYNRSAREFYRDIWWPDMQKVAKRYEDVYTGLFVATYNNIVDPDQFEMPDMSVQQYFGNSLLKNGYEMGAHGYNHQSLTLAGGTPADMHYKPWKSTQDMASSLVTLSDIAASSFPSVTFTTYVPPSNYLSPEGRAAVVQALPQLQVISGIYTNEGENGDVYMQDFCVAQDGIAEFPRITAGMLDDDFNQFSYISAMGLYGVFSHFIHPDDIYDAERSGNQNWEQMYDAYCKMMQDVHDTYPFLRSLTATQAAGALRTEQAAKPQLRMEDKQISCTIENFAGDVCFYLKTEKIPQAADDACTIENVKSQGQVRYYLVTAKRPDFTIRLVEQ